MILALLATLGAVVVAFVLYPVFAPETGEPLSLDAIQSELRDLQEKKTQILANIKDLDFEQASGKLSDSDYQSARDDYLAHVSTVIARIDALAPKTETKTKKKKQTSSSEPKGATIACTKCSEANPIGSKFCVECGAPMDAKCRACGEALPPSSKFCNHCGEKVAG